MKNLIKNIIVFLLNLEAKLVLRKHKPFIISVVGNVGKTSAKEAIYAALKSQNLHVRASKKSFNSELGVPLTILGLPNVWNNPFLWFLNLVKGFLVAFDKNYPDYLVLELGADKKGDLKKLAQLVKSDIAVYVNIPKIPVHLENYKNKDELLNEKKQIALLGLKKEAVIIYDKDAYYTEKILLDIDKKKITYSVYNKEANIYLKSYSFNCDNNKLKSINFDFAVQDKSVSLNQSKNIAKHFAYPLMAALAVSKELSLNLDSVSEFLSSVELGKGRMRLLEGFNGFLILDDTYNASPQAALSAIDTLKLVPCHRRKIAIFGDMLELGKEAVPAHRELIKSALENLDFVFLYGSIMKDVAKEFHSDKLQVFQKDEQEKLISSVKSFVQSGDLVLVKGSQSMRMERVTKALLSEKLNPKDLLVRQEEEWLKKS